MHFVPQVFAPALNRGQIDLVLMFVVCGHNNSPIQPPWPDMVGVWVTALRPGKPTRCNPRSRTPVCIQLSVDFRRKGGSFKLN
jgi:hypothetical protein